MKYVIEFIKTLFISPELCVSVVILTAILILQPEWFDKLGTKIKSDQEVWKYLCIIPAGLFAWMLPHCYLVQLPHSDNKVLLEWPDYWKLKIRVAAAILLSFICTTIAIFVFVFAKEVYANIAGFLMTFAIIVSLIDAYTIWQATITIRQILEKNSKK